MKGVLIFIALICSCLSSADSGNAYRFNLSLISHSGDTVCGYYYHYTYKEYNQHSNTSTNFKDFIEKNSITLYPFITTINLKTFAIDFTKKELKKHILISNYVDIRIIDYLDFSNSDRIYELSNDEFALIKIDKPKTFTVYNETFSENCSFILLSWKNQPNLTEHKKELSEKIKSFTNGITQNHDKLNKNLTHKKDELLKKGILLITHCTPL